MSIFEIIEVQEMNPKDEARFGALYERVKALEGASTGASTTAGIPKGNFLRHNAYWLNWVVPTLALILGSGFVVNYAGLFMDSRVDSRLEKPLERLRIVENGNTRVEAKLDTFLDLVKPVIIDRLKAVVRLPPSEFRERLGEVAGVVDLARNAKLPPPAGTFEGIEKQLQTVSVDARDYWHVVASLVTYKSASSSNLREDLPSCLVKEPVVRLAADIDAKQTTIPLTRAVYEDCEFVIDSTVAAAVRQKFLNFTGLELRRVRIVYRGGEILFPSGSAGPTVFLDCAFVLSVPGEPPKRGRDLIENLLAAMDLKNVSMQIPG